MLDFHLHYQTSRTILHLDIIWKMVLCQRCLEQTERRPERLKNGNNLLYFGEKREDEGRSLASFFIDSCKLQSIFPLCLLTCLSAWAKFEITDSTACAAIFHCNQTLIYVKPGNSDKESATVVLDSNDTFIKQKRYLRTLLLMTYNFLPSPLSKFYSTQAQ